MCCLSEASSHFVVFVCVNPDRKPSRKMKRRKKFGDAVRHKKSGPFDPSTGSGTELRLRRCNENKKSGPGLGPPLKIFEE